MKKTLITTTLFLACFGVFAQALSEKDLQEIQSSFKKDASTKAIQNILTADKDIKGNALNRDLQGKIDHYFKYRADVKGITNQLSSGRCWMFTSMNVLRPSIMKKYNLSQFDFSHNYLYFWDIFEKSNLFLENIIATAKQPMDDRTVVEYFKAPVGDGGVWNLYYNAAEKYGVVPQEVMPETAHSNNTSQMVSIINEKLRQGGYELREMTAAGKKGKELTNAKMATLKEVYRILALCLGEPPHQFTWRYKDKDGKLWVSAFDVESFIIDNRDYIVQKYPLPDLRNQLKANPAINSLCKDEDGIFWFSQDRYGLCIYDSRKEKLKHYSQCQGTRNLPFGDVTNIADHITTTGYGLLRMAPPSSA